MEMCQLLVYSKFIHFRY